MEDYAGCVHMQIMSVNKTLYGFLLIEEFPDKTTQLTFIK